MTWNELENLINRGEDSKLEFKQDLPHADSIAAEIVAFGNMDGGLILFGVQDDGTICGLPNPDAEERLINICRQNVDPPIIPVIERLVKNNLHVLVMHIPKCYTVMSTRDGRYFLRVGSTKRQPSKQELARLFQRSRQIQFDETLVEAAGIEDIDFEKVNIFLRGLGQPAISESKIPTENLLLNLRILQKNDDGIYPSIAGLLTFGKKVQFYLPGARIDAAYYRGESRNSEVLDHKEIGGTVIEQIENAVKFVQNNMRVGSKLEGIKRIEFPDYTLEAVREAITNAVAHRNYNIIGSSIRLLMYDNRLEVLSPGGLPNTVTLDNIKIVQFSRNQLLVSYLAGSGYMEKRGEGILRMINWSLKNNAPEPQFSLPADELFQVTLFKREAVNRVG